MKLDDQIVEIVDYFKKGEKNSVDFRIGSEFEHFIIDKDTFRTINYYEKDGVEDTLRKLILKGWEIEGSDIHVMSLIKKRTTITLEPGAQIELSIKPHIEIELIEKEYLSFLSDIIPILEEKNQALISIGYHPKSRIENIPFIPKKRYEYMSKYFESKGKYAINMMKGTCSTQVTLDYSCEEDYIKKFRVANVLSTLVATMFDNSPFFEGERYEYNALRNDIWQNCDNDRCGVIKECLNKEFGYLQYADYILNNKPILIKENDKFKFTDNALVKDLFNPYNYSIEDLEHILTMVFPDVRTKKFIEIRMTDSVPYPYNMSIIALWKGLLYDEENLNELYDYLIHISNSDIEKSKVDIINKKFNTNLKNINLYELGIKIINMAKSGLNDNEKKYITPLEDMFSKKMSPLDITKNNLDLGKKEALEWCMLNNLNRGRLYA